MSLLEDLFLQSPSSTTMLGAVLFLLVLLLFLSSSSIKEQGKEPPGPRPLPLLGNLLHMDPKMPFNTLYKLSKTYGSIFTFHFGPVKVVVLAGYKTVKQALVNHGEAFGERLCGPIINDLNLTHGIIFATGESWQEMRRFAFTNLRNFGMGKKTSEEKIIDECQQLIEVFRKKEGKAFDTSESVNYAVSNIICSLVYGIRFEYDDPAFTAMVNQSNMNTKLLGSPSVQLYNNFPRLFKWIRNRKFLLKGAFANRKQMTELIGGLQETLNPQMYRCIIDSFLVRKKQLEESGDMNNLYHKDNLLATVVNLFTAGTDTTSATLRYGLLFMAKYPKIQDQVQEELSRVVGSRQIRAEDRKNLPYTDAVIHETQRLANIVPILLHSTTEDVTLQGYLIKKGTAVYSLLGSALQDENEWDSPDTFNPAHFLDKEGQFVKRDAFIPFSIGQRVCIGENLARMELFLFFTSLLQRFRFTPPPGVTEDELDPTPVLGFTLSPTPHQLCAVSCV